VIFTCLHEVETGLSFEVTRLAFGWCATWISDPFSKAVGARGKTGSFQSSGNRLTTQAPQRAGRGASSQQTLKALVRIGMCVSLLLSLRDERFFIVGSPRNWLCRS
jgi:hypothetical protein